MKHQKLRLLAGLAGALSVLGLSTPFLQAGDHFPFREQCGTNSKVQYEMVPHVVIPQTIEYKPVAKNKDVSPNYGVQSTHSGFASPYAATYIPFPSYTLQYPAAFYPLNQALYPVTTYPQQQNMSATQCPLTGNCAQNGDGTTSEQNRENASPIQGRLTLGRSEALFQDGEVSEDADDGVLLVSAEEEQAAVTLALGDLEDAEDSSMIRQAGLFGSESTNAWSFSSPLFKVASIPAQSLAAGGQINQNGPRCQTSLTVPTSPYPPAPQYNLMMPQYYQLPNGMVVPTQQQRCGPLRNYFQNKQNKHGHGMHTMDMSQMLQHQAAYQAIMQHQMGMMPGMPYGMNGMPYGMGLPYGMPPQMSAYGMPMPHPGGLPAIMPVGNTTMMPHPMAAPMMNVPTAVPQYATMGLTPTQQLPILPVQYAAMPQPLPLALQQQQVLQAQAAQTVPQYAAMPMYYASPYMPHPAGVPQLALVPAQAVPGYANLAPQALRQLPSLDGTSENTTNSGTKDGEENRGDATPSPLGIAPSTFQAHSAAVAMLLGAGGNPASADQGFSETTPDQVTPPSFPQPFPSNFQGQQGGMNGTYIFVPNGYQACQVPGAGFQQQQGLGGMSVTELAILITLLKDDKGRRGGGLRERIAERRERRRPRGADEDPLAKLMQGWCEPYYPSDSALRMPSKNAYPYGYFGAAVGSQETAPFSGYNNFYYGSTMYPAY